MSVLKIKQTCYTCTDASGNDIQSLDPCVCKNASQDVLLNTKNGCSCKSCLNDSCLFSSFAYRYQNLKRIQHTVRVDSSQYTMNLASVTSYDKATTWNNMSDRFVRSQQKGGIEKKLLPSWRPGCLTPGGDGCDIKHNSYQRHLNRLKGNKILKAQKVPPEMVLPYIPFNRAAPIYGDKLCKTSIMNCFCK